MGKNTASGVTFQSPLSVSSWKSEECTADGSDTAETRKWSSEVSMRLRSDGGCVKGKGKRDEVSPPGSQQDTRQDQLSNTSLRQLQAKMEADSQQVKEIIRPLLDTENGLMKEVEMFLSQRDVTELRRRELLHKRWTEHVWFPLQKRVEEHVSRCSPAEVKRRQSLYNHYLHHCNIKGYVFLETYDLKEYNPFLVNIKKPQFFKVNTTDLKDSLQLQLHERLRDKRTTHSHEAGSKYTRRQVEKLPHSERLRSESATSKVGSKTPQASSTYPVAASRKSSVKDETNRKWCGRPGKLSYHVRATSAPDGRCHQSDCWFSTSGRHERPASLQQHLCFAKSK